MVPVFGNGQVLLAHAPAQHPQWSWGMCHRSWSNISPNLHPRAISAPHCIPHSSTSQLQNTVTSFFHPQASRQVTENGETLEKQTWQQGLRGGIQGHCQDSEGGAAEPPLPRGTEDAPSRYRYCSVIISSTEVAVCQLGIKSC